MILTTHALTGAVIGKNIENTWLVIILALIIHYLLDTFRHGEYFDDRYAKIRDTWWKVTLDLLATFSILFSFFSIQDWNEATLINVSIGVFFSLLPDGLTLLYYFKLGGKILIKIKSFHSFCHCYFRFPKYGPERQWTLRNARNDILISLLSILLLFFF